VTIERTKRTSRPQGKNQGRWPRAAAEVRWRSAGRTLSQGDELVRFAALPLANCEIGRGQSYEQHAQQEGETERHAAVKGDGGG